MLPKVPAGRSYGCYDGEDCGEMSKWELKNLEEHGVEVVFYWYITASYEGSGHLIAINKEGKWCEHNMGHCSCYGPTENFHAEFDVGSLDALAGIGTKEFNEEISELVELAKSKGYK
jgi:hypothetical protein